MADQLRTVTEADFTTRWDDGHTFPFIESEDCDITGYGHQDKAEFAQLVTKYDEVATGQPMPEEEAWDEDHVSHGWAVVSEDGEYLLTKDVTETTPGAFPVTTLWNQR